MLKNVNDFLLCIPFAKIWALVVGIWDTYWGVFSSLYPGQKLKLNLIISRAERSPPLKYSIQILDPEDQSEGRYYFSNRARFWPGDTIRDVLSLLYQDLHNLYSIFFVQKDSKKDENMISWTRLSVESTDTLMGQARKSRLLILLKEWRENMREHNSFFIITTSKGSKKAFWKVEY